MFTQAGDSPGTWALAIIRPVDWKKLQTITKRLCRLSADRVSDPQPLTRRTGYEESGAFQGSASCYR
jgi:hypothetical protein